MPAPATPRLLRRINAQRVLDVMRAADPLRATELVARTGLSRPTVDAVADDLVRLGWLEESAADARAVAARPVCSRFARPPATSWCWTAKDHERPRERGTNKP